MQQLHLVGLTTDLDGLIFSARKGAKSGGYVIDLDDRLLATIADTIRRRDEHGEQTSATARALERAAGVTRRPSRPESTLNPREIQTRLRAGRSIDDVAEEAGVDVDWVERFAAPIQAEQAQVVAKAAAFTYVRPRQGPSLQPLATAVRWNLLDRGVPPSAASRPGAWSAHHVHESVWIIRFQYRSRGRPQLAEWEVDLNERTLIAHNRLGAALAHVEKGRRRRAVVEEELEEEEAPPQRARRRTPARKAAATRKKAPAKKVAAAPARKKAAAKKKVAAPAKKKATPAKARNRAAPMSRTVAVSATAARRPALATNGAAPAEGRARRARPLRAR